VSRPHVSAVFIEVFGQSLGEELRERQVKRAEELLAQTGKSIAEIAVASGFGTERTFYRVFRALRGMTPGTFRKTVPNVSGRRER
jgi:AraC family transcriptional regulator of adaptative response / DNA-3-methyladenine glycosylase II